MSIKASKILKNFFNSFPGWYWKKRQSSALLALCEGIGGFEFKRYPNKIDIYNFNTVLIVEISPVEKLRQIAWLLVWYIKWQGVKSFLFAHTYHLGSTRCPQRDQKLCLLVQWGYPGVKHRTHLHLSVNVLNIGLVNGEGFEIMAGFTKLN